MTKSPRSEEVERALERAVKGVRNCLSSECSRKPDQLIIGMMISVDCPSAIDQNHLSISVIYTLVNATEIGPLSTCDDNMWRQGT